MTTVQDIPEVKLLEYRMTLGMTTMEGRGFYAPTDVGIAEDGRMYVANRSLENVTRGVRVTMCDIDSEYYGTFASYGQSPGQFVWPSACNLDSRGRVYVSDEATHRISVFDREGALLSTWGEHGAGEGQLDTPSGLAFDADDNVYVADTYNHRVQKFTDDGRFLLAFGREGGGDGEFTLPWGLTVGADGCVYVADWGNDRIQKFAADGTHLASFGTPGRGDGEFHRPAGVAVDANGYIYVADWGNERVQVLDRRRRLRAEAAGRGHPVRLGGQLPGDQRGGGRRPLPRQPGTRDRVFRGRPPRGIVPHRKVFLVARVGQAGPGRQPVRNREQPAPHPGVPTNKMIGKLPSVPSPLMGEG